MSITNPAPSLPTVTVLGLFGAISVSYDVPSDTDWEGTIIAMSTTNPPNTTTDRVVKSIGNTFVISEDKDGNALLPETDYYIKVAAYDAFGEDGITWSGVYTVRSIQLPSGYYVSTDNFTASGTEVTIPEITTASLATKAKGTHTTDSWASDTVTGLVQTPLDMDSANAWDSEDGTDYSVPANRESSTFYMHFTGNNRHVPYSVTIPVRRGSGGAWNMFAPLGPTNGEPTQTYTELKADIEAAWSGTTVSQMYILDDNNEAGFPALTDPEFVDVTASSDPVNYGKGMWVKLTGTDGDTNLSLSGYTTPVEWEVFKKWSVNAMPVGVPHLGIDNEVDSFEATLPFDVNTLWWWNGQDNAWASWTKGVPEFLNAVTSIEAGYAYYFNCDGSFDTEQRYVINHPELRHVFSPNADVLQTRKTVSSFSGSNISISGTTATVTDTGHGAMTEDTVELTGFTAPTGIKDSEFNNVHSITRVDDDTYTFTVTTGGSGTASGTGTIKHTHSDSVRVAKITTDASGDIASIITYRSGI